MKILKNAKENSQLSKLLNHFLYLLLGNYTFMIKILTLNNTMPNVKSLQTDLFENLLPILKSKTGIHLTWVIYKPEKLKKTIT